MPEPVTQAPPNPATPAQAAPSSTQTNTPSPAPDPAQAPAGTILDGKVAAPAAPSDTDWRNMIAGDDTEAVERLGRFKSGKDFLKSFDDAQAIIRSGAHKDKATLSDEPTPEELATYRTENGIPLESKGYLEGLPDGLVMNEDDEALVSSFLERSHAANRDPEAVHDMLDWYANEVVPQQEQAQAEADKQGQAAAIEELRSAWGGDYKANLASALNFLETTAPRMEDGTSVANLILGSRLGDGRLAGDHPQFLQWLSGLAHDANPAGFIAPGSGLSQEQSVSNEIKEIEGLMKTDPQAYYADEAKQERLRSLYGAREKLSSTL